MDREMEMPVTYTGKKLQKQKPDDHYENDIQE